MPNSRTRHALLIVAIIAATATVFSFDLMIELGVAGGVLYVGVVSLAYWARDRRLIWIVAASCCVLTVLAYFLSPPGGEVWKVLFNRAIALFAIGVTAALCDVAQRAERRLRQSAEELQHRVEERLVELARSTAELQFAYTAAQGESAGQLEDSAITWKIGDEVAGIASFGDSLVVWARQARDLIGAHQSAVSYFAQGNISKGEHAISLSKKYDKYRTYNVPPTGEGIWSLVIKDKRGFCLTDDELQAHPAWNKFSDLRDERGLEHPPMRGWLAVPVLGRRREFLGILQLSDKYDGDFTQQDLQQLTRLAQLVAPSFSLQYANEQLQRRAVELEKRTEDAELARAWAEAAERQLEEVASQLTLSPRGFDHGNRTFSIGRFSLSDMMICGATIRGLSHQNRTFSAFGRGLVQFLYEQFRDEQGQPEFALVRLFRTQRFVELEQSLQEFALSISPGIHAETVCLALVATMGNRPEWCDPLQSAGHQAIPLPSEDAIKRLPMISQLLQQLGLSVTGVLQPQSGVMAGEVETGVFHIPQAEGSPHIPAQQEFVIPFGIRSVVGFGGVLPDGSLFVVIGFAKKDISRDVAQLFSHLSHSTRLGLLSNLVVHQKMVAQVRAFERLLADREEIVADQEARVRQAMAELAHMNEALEQSNVELQQFAYIASHDLQAPLRSVAGFAGFLQRDYQGQLDEKADDFIERIADGTKRMQQLIDDLLAYSRVELRAAPFQAVSLNEVFDDAVTLLKDSIEDLGGEVTRDELPTVSGDRAQLSQLMQNLIGNGVKYHGYDPPQVHASAKPSGSNWTIAVRDNGIGVASENHEKIFEIFHRLHTQQAYPGTGIGLAICRRIVKRHGGTIWLESQPGKSSTFYFTLLGCDPVAAGMNRLSSTQQTVV